MMHVKRFRPVCQFLEDGTPVAVLCEFPEGYVSGDDYDALAAQLAEAERFIEENCACGCAGFTMMQDGKEVPYVCPRCALLNSITDSASAAPFHDAICERRDPKVYACFCDTRKAGGATVTASPCQHDLQEPGCTVRTIDSWHAQCSACDVLFVIPRPSETVAGGPNAD